MLASGADVNILVFDTDILQHRRTGVQGLKSGSGMPVRVLRPGQTAQGAGGDGHELRLCLCGAGGHGRGQGRQTLKAMAEAEAYRGPSIIIAYSPCELHS